MKNKKTVVLGASTKPERYSFKAITKLVENGHSVLAIGQNKGEVAGISIYTKNIPLKNIDTITLYLNPLRQKEYYNSSNCEAILDVSYVSYIKPPPETHNSGGGALFMNNTRTAGGP